MSAFNYLAAVRQRAVAACAMFVLATGTLVLAMSWQSSAAANPAYPPTNSCSFSAAQGLDFTPGEQLTLLGSGFGPNEQVRLTIHSSAQSLGTVTTNTDGAFRTSVTLPSDLGAGSHVLTASSPSTSCSFDPILEPTSQGQSHNDRGIAGVSATKPTSGSGGSGMLASTGFQTATAIGIGVVILGGGTLLLVIGRRRKA